METVRCDWCGKEHKLNSKIRFGHERLIYLAAVSGILPCDLGECHPELCSFHKENPKAEAWEIMKDDHCLGVCNYHLYLLNITEHGAARKTEKLGKQK